ncbi:hypothetical protein GCM10027082_28230 [Comamonas humi]
MQELIVGVIVAAAAVSLVWRYLPARWRSKAGRLHPSLAPKSSSGCGGCSACGGDSCSDTGGKRKV